METVIRIKPSELTPDFIDKVKRLFKNDEAIEISISSVSDFGLTKEEDKKGYEDRVNRAIKNLEENRDTISFSEGEFESLINDLPIRK
jgi:diphthamide synthase (EF-2-diphthine--ammonia ligase)